MKRPRDIVISAFVVLWILAFHYESIRGFYLEPAFQRTLPKVKFLFPPAGWIMFYNVGDDFVFAEVYGGKGETLQRIDPHDIFRTRAIGYDNIHRNVMVEVLSPGLREPFCRFLQRKFPIFDRFVVKEGIYPSVTRAPMVKIEEEAYRCGPE